MKKTYKVYYTYLKNNQQYYQTVSLSSLPKFINDKKDYIKIDNIVKIWQPDIDKTFCNYKKIDKLLLPFFNKFLKILL